MLDAIHLSRRHARRRTQCHAAHRCWCFEALEERTLLTLQGNLLFPADNPWNQPITTAPVAANSATLVASIGSSSRLHPDFGTIYQGGYIGIPFNVVTAAQPKVMVVIDAYADESDLVPVPIPAGAVIEGDPLPASQNDGDRHLIVYDKDNNVAYELFNVHRPAETVDGKWHADSEAVWDMSQNSFRTPGDTSADAAGLPILPGLVRPDEVLDQGLIQHALRFTVPSSRNTYVFPASHQAGSNNAALPRMGERFRLKQSFDISGFSPANRVILQALKDYGMIVADNGSGWFLSGEPSTRWNDDDLHALTAVVGSNFEAVSLTPAVSTLDQTSGPGGTQVTVHGRGFSGAAGQLKVFFDTTQATAVSIVSDSVLVATAPAHPPGTVDVTVQTPYGTSPTSSSDRFTFSAASATVVARRLIYNQSAFDGASAAINAGDNGAIAGDKSAYLPGAGLATFANVSSYSRGINGIMVDLSSAGGSHASITASDFVFKVGNNNTAASWTAAPAPSAVAVSIGGGVGSSNRVTITWATGAIQNRWLEVQVLATTRTGLASPDVFFWGNKIADSGTSPPLTDFETTTTDAAQVFATLNAGPVAITNLRDYNRDGAVNSTDAAIVFATLGSIPRINIGSAGPFAAEGNSGAGIASALAATFPGSIAATDSPPSSPPDPDDDLRENGVFERGRIIALLRYLAEMRVPEYDLALAEGAWTAAATGLEEEPADWLAAALED